VTTIGELLEEPLVTPGAREEKRRAG